MIMCAGRGTKNTQLQIADRGIDGRAESFSRLLFYGESARGLSSATNQHTHSTVHGLEIWHLHPENLSVYGCMPREIGSLLVPAPTPCVCAFVIRCQTGYACTAVDRVKGFGVASFLPAESLCPQTPRVRGRSPFRKGVWRLERRQPFAVHAAGVDIEQYSELARSTVDRVRLREDTKHLFTASAHNFTIFPTRDGGRTCHRPSGDADVALVG